MNPKQPKPAAGSDQPGERPRRRSQAERTAGTRKALVAAARKLFEAHGYAEVGAEQIVRAAGLTRGALYHHFPGGKRDLLEAVYEQVEAESTERVAHIVLDSEMHSPLAGRNAARAAFLGECAEPGFQRTALHDAPAVLGWDRWRQISESNGLGLIEASLIAAIEAGGVRPP